MNIKYLSMNVCDYKASWLGLEGRGRRKICRLKEAEKQLKLKLLKNKEE